MPLPFADAIDHLTAELERLELLLRRQILRLRAAHVLTADDFRGLYVPDAQVDAMLREGVLGATPGPDVARINELLGALQAAIGSRVEESRAAGIALPLLKLSGRLNLGEFERSVLVLAAAPEFNQRYEVLFAYAQNDVTRKRPTVGLALSLFCAHFRDAVDHGPAFLPDAPLLQSGLIRLTEEGQDKDPVHLSRFLRMDHRVARFLLGKQDLDEKLMAFTRRIDPLPEGPDLILAEEQRQEIRRTAQVMRSRAGIVLIEGPQVAGKLAVASAICREMQLPLLCADLYSVPGKVEKQAELMALLAREAWFTGSAVHLRHFEALLAGDDPGVAERAVAALVRGGTPVFLASQTAWRPAAVRGPEQFFHIRLPIPGFRERVRLWEHAVSANGHAPVRGGADFTLLANKFALTPGQIQAAVAQARQMAGLRGETDGRIHDEELHLAARRQSNEELRRLAQRITPIHTWDQIILPQRTLQQLREICLHVQYRHVVYGDWGFDRRLSLGKGVKSMFSGPSGVGKTMATEVLANELNLDLYKIDLSMVVSKYIGETEKNLNAIFREAQSSNAMLFFDEADALFGKRSEIKDAHDRYANIEVSYLLQKMEEYEGIVVLATNLTNNIDDAFVRRLHHSVEFPFPDSIYRERIWRGMFAREAPLGEDVDFGFLARQFELAGGNIRNVAVSAAFLAVQSGGRIKMEHLVQATARELHKMGRLPLKSNFREYFELIRESG